MYMLKLMKMKVLKRNGKLEDVSFDKVIKRLQYLKSMEPVCESIDPIIISQKVVARIYQGVKTSELDELAARICTSMVTTHPNYLTLASIIFATIAVVLGFLNSERQYTNSGANSVTRDGHGLKIGESQYYAKDQSEEDVFKIKKDLVAKLAVDLQKLRDKKMVRFERNEIKRVEVALPEKRFEFVRDMEGKWRMESPAGYKEKTILEYKLFWPLEDLEGKEIVDQANLNDPKYGFMQPSAEVKLVKEDDKITTIVLGKTQGEVVFGKSVAEPTLYKVDKKVLEDLNFKVDEIIEKSE